MLYYIRQLPLRGIWKGKGHRIGGDLEAEGRLGLINMPDWRKRYGVVCSTGISDLIYERYGVSHMPEFNRKPLQLLTITQFSRTRFG
jgi:hypothetical protein